MTDMNEEKVANPTERYRWKPGKPRLGRFLSNVCAGAIGAVLTLAVVTNTGWLQTKDVQAKNEVPLAQTEEKSSYTVQQTAMNSTTLVDMIENASKAIVGVVNYKHLNNRFAPGAKSAKSGSGSGVIFKKDGDSAFIVTNNHVIEGAEKIEVSLESGETTTAELVGTDALTDLAVLKIDAKYADTILEFGDSDQLRAGEQVVAIGNPLGLDFSRTVTQGIISAVDRSINVQTSAGEWDLNVVQTDAAINPGNSGGALINTEGKVIGINSLKISQNGIEGLGFAIPSNDVVPLIDEMMKNGKVERPYMGVSLAELAQVPRSYIEKLPIEVKGGVMIGQVEPNSAADNAGLQAQDIIIGVNEKEINNARDLRKILYTDFKKGDKATLKVYRGSELKTIEITFN